ncbi:MAG: tetratricopeptide repeat protein [Candidatus Cloacimonetes bacterium]|nr:tetratricopeptide repeat protein [Candidatus Cloacimonadota bacterium]
MRIPVRSSLFLWLLLFLLPVHSISGSYGSADPAQYASELMIRGNYAGADSAYTKALELYPYNISAITGSIGAKIALKHNQDAVAVGLFALKRGITAAGVFQSTAYAAYLTENYWLALFCYRKSMRYGIENATDLAGIGWCFYNLKHYNDARRSFTRALAFDANYESALQGLKSVKDNWQISAFGYFGTSTDKFTNYLVQSGVSWKDSRLSLSYDYFDKDNHARRDYSAGFETSWFGVTAGAQFHTLQSDYKNWYPANCWLAYFHKPLFSKYGQFTPGVLIADSRYQTFSVYQFESTFSWSYLAMEAEATTARIYLDSVIPDDDRDDMLYSVKFGYLLKKQWQLSVKWETGQRDFVMYRDGFVRDNLDTSKSEISMNLWWLWKPVNLFAGCKLGSNGEATCYTGIGRYVKL